MQHPHRTLVQLLSVPIRGNFEADQDLLDELFLFAANAANPIHERAQAIHHIDKVMSLPGMPFDDDKMVELFMEQLAEDEVLDEILDELAERGIESAILIRPESTILIARVTLFGPDGRLLQ